MVYSSVFKTATLVSTLLASLGVANASQDLVWGLTHPTGSNVVMLITGAQINQFCAANDPSFNLLFKSQQEREPGRDPMAGGIPIVFPNVAESEGLPRHGFARSIPWEIVSSEDSHKNDMPSVATFRLASSERTRPIWPVEFVLEYEVKLYSSELQTTLRVQNTFTEAIEFDAMLLNHFYTHDIRDYHPPVSGLQGVQYFDRVSNTSKTDTESFSFMESQTDRLYSNAPNNVNVQFKRDVYNQTLYIDKSGSITDSNDKTNVVDTDIALWNPWTQGDSDLGEGEYVNMVRISSGRVSKKVVLQAGETFSLYQSIHAQQSNTAQQSNDGQQSNDAQQPNAAQQPNDAQQSNAAQMSNTDQN